MSQTGTPALPFTNPGERSQRQEVGSPLGLQNPKDDLGDAGKSKQAADPQAKGEGSDELTKEQKELATRLASLIEGANNELIPITKMIRRHIDGMFDRPEDQRDENELVAAVKPLLEQGEKILNETSGAIKGADPGQELSNRAKRNVADHKACPEEQRLAEALKVMIEEVGGTIEWAKDKLNSFPKAKKDLGPLLDALGQPLTQIVGGVGLLLAGVLNLVGRLLDGLGLGSLLSGILCATGLDKIYKGLGVGSWLKY